MEWQIFNTLKGALLQNEKLDSLYLKNGERYKNHSKSFEFRGVAATCMYVNFNVMCVMYVCYVCVWYTCM